jgi:UDP-N-acetylmuramate--alanine ligase
MRGNKCGFKIHFIGIGGIGVSALARYYIHQGWKVSGSDIKASEITKELQYLGAKIYTGSRILKKTMPGLLVYSPAVKKDDPELEEARALGIKSMSYPQALGRLSKIYKTIAISGAHGKSTTTAMIGLMMAAAKLDPTVIVGTKVKEFGNSNFRAGGSEFLVIEACEYDRSFLNYWPQIAVITNIEMDHVECYKTEAKLVSVFKEFAGHLPETGTLVVCGDDANALSVAALFKKPRPALEKYSVKQSEAAKLREILSVPGEHNVANALAALTVGRILGIDDSTIFSSLAKFRGSWRRFEQARGAVGGKKIAVVSDYGHHPTQIKMTIEAARAKWPGKKIICVFQPHQAYRTHLLFKGFVETLKAAPADKILVTDIYKVAGRESAEITAKVSSRKLVEAVGKESVEYVLQAAVLKRLESLVKGGEILLVMGAGDIYGLSKKIISG